MDNLRQGQNLVYKSNRQSGKSFGGLVYMINKALCHPHEGGVQSIIVVPNHSLLLKYKHWVQGLVQEIDPHCVPPAGEREIGGENTVHQVNPHRSPLVVSLIDRAQKLTQVSTDDSTTTRDYGHIVIIHQAAFDKLMHASQLSKLSQLKNTDLVMIDETDFLISGTMCSAASFNITQSAKGRYQFVLENALKKLKEIKLHHQSVFTPLQYCFIFHSHHPYFQSYVTALNNHDAVAPDHDSDVNHNAVDHDKIMPIINDIVKLTNHERTLTGCRQSTIGVIDNFSVKQFFDNDDKKINISFKNLRANFSKPVTDTINISANYPEKSKFMEIFRNSTFNFRDYNYLMLYGDKLRMRASNRKTQLFKQLNHITNDFRQTFKTNQPILFVVPSYVEQHGYITKFNNHHEVNNSPERIIGLQPLKTITNTDRYLTVPKDMKLPPFHTSFVQNFFNYDFSHYNADYIYNLLVPANELPGMDIHNIKNIVLLGRVTQAQTAGLEFNCHNIAKISQFINGIKVPINDLYQYYFSKLKLESLGPGEKINMMVVQDTYYDKTVKQLNDLEYFLSDLNITKNQILGNDIPTLTNEIITEVPGQKVHDLSYDETIIPQKDKTKERTKIKLKINNPTKKKIQKRTLKQGH